METEYTNSKILLRYCTSLVSAMLAMAAGAARAEPGFSSSWKPNQVFVQAGIAEDAKALTAGLIWMTDWSRPFRAGQLSLYWEVSFGRWSADQPNSSSSWVTQLGVTPVLRWYPGGGSTRWFVEGGIGANALLPIYRSREKRFSTTLNFGSHLAIGFPFGDRERHELALRLEHFSNAGIRRPNPGEDFVQLRHTFQF
jgi:lipid A 3-O-deacylase